MLWEYGKSTTKEHRKMQTKNSMIKIGLAMLLAIAAAVPSIRACGQMAQCKYIISRNPVPPTYDGTVCIGSLPDTLEYTSPDFYSVLTCGDVFVGTVDQGTGCGAAAYYNCAS